MNFLGLGRKSTLSHHFPFIVVLVMFRLCQRLMNVCMFAWHQLAPEDRITNFPAASAKEDTEKINSESHPYVCGGNFHFNLLRVYSILFSVQDLQQEGKSSKGHQSGGGGMICRQEVFTMSRT